MKKKLLMRLAAAALAVGMCLSSAGASYFTDVSPNAWYYDAVTECSDYGLLNGYQNGTFRPNATITRAECAALLDRMVDPDEPLGSEIGYQDVSQMDWYYMATKGGGQLLGGVKVTYTNKSPVGYYAWFYPKKACTREDFAYGLGCVLYDLEDEGGSGFNDYQQINPQYRDTIMKLRHNGIINGDGVGRYGYFHPKKTITRAEVAQILYNMIEIAES